MKKNKTRIIAIIIAIVVIVIITILIWYKTSLGPVKKTNEGEEIEIDIESGTSTPKIIQQLQEKKLIKNKLSVAIYVKLNKIKNLQAGKYILNNSLSAKEILENISEGNVNSEEIKITFLEGKNMRWIASKIDEETNNSEEDVYTLLQDKDYIKSLIEKYWFLEDDILNNDIYYPLEGYLAPNTYSFKNKDITVKEIFGTLLDQTDKMLSSYKDKLTNMSIHKLLTVASIVELEGKNYEDRQGIAKVIYNRLSKNMSIGSDVTTYYAVKIDVNERNLTSEEINSSNPYNTRGPNMSGKLPVGPIASVSESSIKATLNPDSSDYLYFVADKDGNIYFAKTYEEHQKNIQILKSNGLWYSYDEE